MSCGNFSNAGKNGDHVITTDDKWMTSLGLGHFTVEQLMEYINNFLDVRRIWLCDTRPSSGNSEDEREDWDKACDPSSEANPVVYIKNNGLERQKLRVFYFLMAAYDGSYTPYIYDEFDEETHRTKAVAASLDWVDMHPLFKKKYGSHLAGGQNVQAWPQNDLLKFNFLNYAIQFNRANNLGQLETTYDGNVSGWVHPLIGAVSASSRAKWKEILRDIKTGQQGCLQWTASNWQDSYQLSSHGWGVSTSSYRHWENEYDMYWNFGDIDIQTHNSFFAGGAPKQPCLKLLQPTFKLFLYDNASHSSDGDRSNKIVINNDVFLAKTPETPYGKRSSHSETRRGKQDPGHYKPTRGDGQDKASAKLDVAYNYNTGTFEGGTHNILARLLTDLQAVSVNSIPVDGVDVMPKEEFFDKDSPTNTAPFSTGWAMPMQTHNGNPHHFGPVWVDPDCEGEKKEKIKVINRSGKSYSAGDIVMCFKIDGFWVIMDFGESGNLGIFGIDNWKFTQYIANRDYYFKNNRRFQKQSGRIYTDIVCSSTTTQCTTQYGAVHAGLSVIKDYSGTLRPQTYEAKYRDMFYLSMKKAVELFAGTNNFDSVVDLNGEYLTDYSTLAGETLGLPHSSLTGYDWSDIDPNTQGATAGYFQVSSFDFVDKIMGGTNSANVIKRTHLTRKPMGVDVELEPDEQRKDEFFPFWGATFPDGYDATKINYLKNKAREQTLSFGVAPLRTRDMNSWGFVASGNASSTHLLLGPPMPSGAATKVKLYQDNLSSTPSTAPVTDQRLIFSESRNTGHATGYDFDDDGVAIPGSEKWEYAKGLWSDGEDKLGLQIPADIATLASPSGENGRPMEDLGGMMRMANLSSSMSQQAIWSYMGYNELGLPNRMTWLTESSTIQQASSGGSGGSVPAVASNPMSDDSLYDFKPNNPNIIEFKPLWMDVVGCFDPYSSKDMGVVSEDCIQSSNVYKNGRNWWESTGYAGLPVYDAADPSYSPGLNLLGVQLLPQIEGVAKPDARNGLSVRKGIYDSTVVCTRWAADMGHPLVERWDIGEPTNAGAGGDGWVGKASSGQGTAGYSCAGLLPWNGIPYGAWTITDGVDTPIPNFMSRGMLDNSSNVVGVIAAKAKVRAKATELSFETTNHLGVAAHMTVSGGGSSFSMIVGTASFVVAGNPAETINRNKTAQWGRSGSDSVWHFGTHALHGRLFDQWPDDQTLFDPRYFAVMHFNPLPKRGMSEDALGHQSYNRSIIETVEIEEHGWGVGTAWTQWNPGETFPTYNYTKEVESTLVDIRVPTFRSSSTVTQADGDIIPVGTIIKGWMHKGRTEGTNSDGTHWSEKKPALTELVAEAAKWRINPVRRGLLLPCLYPHRTIGVNVSPGNPDWVLEGDNLKPMRGAGYRVGDILLAQGGHGNSAELVVTEVTEGDETIDGHDYVKGAIKGLKWNLDQYKQNMRGEGYQAADFWDEGDPKAPASVVFQTKTGSGSGSQIAVKFGIVWDKWKSDDGPRSLSGVNKLTPNSNAPDGTDGVGRVLGRHKTTIALDRPNDDGLYDLFLLHHNDPQHYPRSHSLGTDQFNQYVTLHISTQ